MNSAQPDPPVWNKPNLTRMFIGINIYHDEIRRHIGKKMRAKVGSDWFRDRVVSAITSGDRKWDLERKLNEESFNSEEELIEVRDIPDIVSAPKNRNVFSQLSKLEKQMIEVRKRRNEWAHPAMTDPPRLMANRALKACADVLEQVNEAVAQQVRKLLQEPSVTLTWTQQREIENKERKETEGKLEKVKRQPIPPENGKNQARRPLQRDVHSETIRDLRQRLGDAQRAKITETQAKYKMREHLNVENAKHEETEENLRLARQELDREKNKHKRTQNELRVVERKLKSTEERRREPEQPGRHFKTANRESKLAQHDQGLTHHHPASPTMSRQWETRHQWPETPRNNLDPQPPTKLASVRVRKEVEEFCKKFNPARSGNGRIFRSSVNDWNVRRWVGRRLSEYSACVFPPSRQNKYGTWVRATEEPLIEWRCNSEEEAFEHLWRAEQRDEIDKLAREAIDNYNDLNPPSDDDIPF